MTTKTFLLRAALVTALVAVGLVSTAAYLPLGISSFDAFGRQRVSEPYSLAQAKLLVNDRDDLYDEATTGSGASSAFNTNGASVDLSVTLNTAGSIVRQTRERSNYQPGKGQQVLLTNVVGTTTSGNTKRWGYFDEQNGVFFQVDDDDVVEACVRSYVTGSAVDTCVANGSWNLSNPTIDVTKSQIWAIDFEWLGVGSIKYGVARSDGSIQYVHRIENPNTITGVYMSNPNLPIRWYINNDGTGAAETMEIICASVASEGGSQDIGRRGHVNTGLTALSTGNNTTLYPILAIRVKSSHWRQAVVELEGWQLYTESANVNYRYVLLRDPTTTGTALSFSSAGATSAVEYATPTSATTITGEGTVLDGGFASTGGNSSSKVASTGQRPIQIGVDIDGTSDVIVIAAQNLANSTTDYRAAINWIEKY